jgi:hypothetical protein
MRSKISTSGRITVLLGKHQAATGERMSPRKLAGILGYRAEWLEALPISAIESMAETGNPFSLGELKPGTMRWNLDSSMLNFARGT